MALAAELSCLVASAAEFAAALEIHVTASEEATVALQLHGAAAAEATAYLKSRIAAVKILSGKIAAAAATPATGEFPSDPSAINAHE
jgi:hypothetical protein